MVVTLTGVPITNSSRMANSGDSINVFTTEASVQSTSMANLDGHNEAQMTEINNSPSMQTSVNWESQRLKDSEPKDHICERNYGDVLNVPNQKDLFTCGGCEKKLSTICRLHEHMLQEFISGSYIYDHLLKTAFAKATSFSIGTQTEEAQDVFNKNPEYVNKQTLPVNKIKKAKPTTAKILKTKSINTATERKNTTRVRNTMSKKVKKLKIPKTKLTQITVQEEYGSKSDDNNEIENYQEMKNGNEFDDAIDDKYNDSTDEELGLPVELSQVNNAINDDDNEPQDDDYVPEEDDMAMDQDEEEYVPDRKKTRSSKGKEKRNEKVNKMGKHSETKKKVCQKEIKKDDDSDDEDDKDVMNETTKRPGRPKLKLKLQCEHCDGLFNNEKKLNIHINARHSLIYPFCCIPCKRKPFKTKEEYDAHKEQHPVQIYKCELCSKELRSKEGLRLHVLAHSGLKPYLCDQCDYRGRTAAQLKQHKFNHMDTKTEQCEHCGKAFFTKGKLREHIRYCRKEFNHHCPYCQKGFPAASGLRKHILVHTGERAFVCDVCGFATFRTSLLKSHMRTHTGEKPYKCKFCDAKLASRGTLRLHERTHTHEKPFVCAFCNKAFTSKWNLKTHLRQHTGETPYKCDICGQGFKQNVLRKSHMRCHMETVETSSGGSNLVLDSMEPPPGPAIHRLTEPPTVVSNQNHLDMQQISRESVMVDALSHNQLDHTHSQSHRMLEPSHTPVPVSVQMIHDHYSQPDAHSHSEALGPPPGKDLVPKSEMNNHTSILVPLDLKLHYSSGEYKNIPIYTTTIPTSSSTVISNSFNLINYSS